MSLTFATLFRRVIPRYSTSKQAPPDDFEVGEVVVNFATNQIFAKHPDGTVYAWPSVGRVEGLITAAVNGSSPGVASSSVRVLYADNSSTLYDLRQVYTAVAYTLPGGTMGPNSRIALRAQLYNEDGKNSSIRIKFGGEIVATVSAGLGRSYIVARSLRNRGAVNQQLSDSFGGNYGEAVNVVGIVDKLSVDTAQDVVIELEIDNSGGTNRKCRLESFEVTLWP